MTGDVDVVAAIEELVELIGTTCMPNKPLDGTVALAVIQLEAMGADAKRLAAALSVHLKSASPDLHAILHRAARILEDFSLGVHHTLDSLTPATRAQLAAQ